MRRGGNLPLENKTSGWKERERERLLTIYFTFLHLSDVCP